MNNRVYYGEYSLKHWIDLVLKKNIILPDYQRFFVWNENKVKTLIETFRKNQFVPPVTIGSFNINNTNQNLILDGQQRITSILLAYLGLFPNKSKYKALITRLSSDNDEEDDDDIDLDNLLEWNINKLTEKGNTKETILSSIKDHEKNKKSYDDMPFNIDEKFLDEHFLGFSYLVPESFNSNEQQKYYSSVFRNINIQGEALLPQESRASLYFLEEKLKNLFTPDFCKSIKIRILNNTTTIDFVRYLSLLAQYHTDNTSDYVARGYKQKMEKYYEEYIYSSIEEDGDQKRYGKFSEVFPDKKYKKELENLNTTIENLGFFGEYPSIIDVDVRIFGLVYYIVFKKENIALTDKTDLEKELNLQ